MAPGEGGALYLLPEPIRRLRERYPDVEVVVRTNPPLTLWPCSAPESSNVGLRALTTAPPDLDYRPCLPFDRMLIAPLRHPLLTAKRLTLAMLAAQPFVMPWPQANTRRLVENQFAAKDLQLPGGAGGGWWEVVKRYVGLGTGIAIVPACCITNRDRRDIGARSARSLFGQDVYGILLRRDHVLSAAAQALVHLIETASDAK